MRYWLWVSFSLNGRIGRGAWWGANFAWVALGAVFFLGMEEYIVPLYENGRDWFGDVLIALWFLAGYISFALNVKRFHDQGMSGVAYVLAILWAYSLKCSPARDRKAP